MKNLLLLFFAFYPVADGVSLGNGLELAELASDILLVLATFFLIKRAIFDKQRTTLSLPIALIAILLIFCILSEIWAYDLELFDSNIEAFARTCALVLVTGVFIDNREDVNLLLRSFIVGTLLLASLIAYEFLVRTNTAHGSGAANFSLWDASPNVKAMQMCIGVALLLGHARILENVTANYAVAAVLLAAIMLTGSKVALFACAVIASIYMHYNSDIQHAIPKWLAVMLCFSVVYILWPFGNVAIDPEGLANMPQEGVTSDLLSSWSIWSRALLTFADHPIIGIGYGTFEQYSEDVYGAVPLAKNTHFYLLAETGIVGYLLFAAVYSLIPIYLVRLKDIAVRRTYLSVFAALFIFSMTLNIASQFICWVLLILLERTVNSRTMVVISQRGEHKNPELEQRLQALRRSLALNKKK